MSISTTKDETKTKPNGLELLQQMANGQIPGPAMADTMGMKLSHAEEGFVIFLATADERHTNPLGGVHGGFAATVLDSVTGCAVHSMLPPRIGYGTIDLNVKMLKAIPPGIELIAEGRIISISKRLGVADGLIKDDEGTIYAHGSATCMILR